MRQYKPASPRSQVGARNTKAKRERENREVSSLVLRLRVISPLLILFLALPNLALAHGDDHHADNAIKDHVVLKQGKYELTLRLIPQSVLPPNDWEAAVEHKKTSKQTYTARVGELAFLVADLKHHGKPVKDVHYTLRFEHIEDDKTVFTTTSPSPDGRMTWGHQFFDGAAHRVTLIARGVDADEFTPLTAKMLIGVEAIQPPSSVIMRSMVLLLAITAGAIAVGYCGMYFWLRRKLGATA